LLFFLLKFSQINFSLENNLVILSVFPINIISDILSCKNKSIFNLKLKLSFDYDCELLFYKKRKNLKIRKNFREKLNEIKKN